MYVQARGQAWVLFLEHGLPFFDIGSLTAIEKPKLRKSKFAGQRDPATCLSHSP